MGQILFNYPGMMATAGEMEGHIVALRTVGQGVAAEQAALSAGWQGDTGTTYQAWQAQWNSVLEELTSSYNMMTKAHEQNTNTMMARDQAEGAKWA